MHRLRLPHHHERALGILDHAHPADVEHVERGRVDACAELLAPARSVASALSTVTYEFHNGGTPASRCACGCGEIAATGWPATIIIE